MASWQRKPDSISAGEWLAFRQGWRPALWHPGLPSAPTPQPSGRWHIEHQGYAQYFALTPAAAWAEVIRLGGIRRKRLLRKQRRHLWWFEVIEDDVADLSTFEQAADCGLDPYMLIDDDLSGCQTLAQELIAHGYRGVMSPSAALPGEVVLTLFGPRLEYEVHTGFGAFDQRRNLRPDVYVTTGLLARGATAPPYLLQLVRYPGAPHLEYERWRQDHERESS